MNRAAAPQPVLSRFNPAQPGAQGMKAVATGLLVVMAGVFAVTRALEPSYPWLAYVKSFAEAAMVGGLADWFAVTALFRHPLGLPIPHTAIIPRNKDRTRDRVRKRANWVPKPAGLDTGLAAATIEGLGKLTAEMSTDPAHPVRLKIEEALVQLANDLQTKPETRERVESIKEQLLDNKSVSLWLDTLWQKGREAVIRAARNPAAAMAGNLGGHPR